MNLSSRKSKEIFGSTSVPRSLLLVHVVLTLVYFAAISLFLEPGNRVLYGLLLGGQVFLVFQAIMYTFTVWDTHYQHPKKNSYQPPVDVLIPVAGEPVEIVRETVKAAKGMTYPGEKHIYILNDGYVAKKENWRDVIEMAEEEGVHCVTRTVPGGAKAGNINNGLTLSESPLVAIFDADHAPHEDFLKKTISYFSDDEVAFVQTPQYYKNYELNFITRTAWEQQQIFFGPISKGKNRMNAATMAGTNMVIRRQALDDVGGMCTESIAEDFVTGVFMHERGWRSVYVPEVLAEGLAPEDFQSYYKQQFRWARGALDILFRYQIFTRPGLSMAQRLQYFSSASYFLSGIVVLMNAIFPLAFFYLGMVPFATSTMAVAAFFLPYMFLTLYILEKTTNASFTFNSLGFSMGAFTIHISALMAAMLKKKSAFVVTSKKGVSGNFVHLVIPHMLYIAAVIVGIGVGLQREGLSPSFINNIAWASLNVAVFMPFIIAAVTKPQTMELAELAFAAETQTPKFFPRSSYGIKADENKESQRYTTFE